MSKDSAKARVKVIKPRIPKFCICPFCNTKQDMVQFSLKLCL